MHLVQTYAFWGRPFIKIRIFLRLGRKLRLVVRTIFLPVPPFFLDKPFRTIILPVSACLPQRAHIFNIV